ncbi:MAG: hypothetical protein ABEJ97_09005 [Halobellus sp.]
MSAPRVRVHLHYAMTGSYPLRLVDLLFCERRVLVVEYDYLTGFDLATGSADGRAAAFAATLDDDGLAAARAAAEHEYAVDYADVDRVVVYDGGRFGREKVVLDRTDAPPVRVRVHGDVDVEALCAALESTLSTRAAVVERKPGTGVRLRERLRRLGRAGRRRIRGLGRR